MIMRRGRDCIGQDGSLEVRARCTEWRPPVVEARRASQGASQGGEGDGKRTVNVCTPKKKPKEYQSENEIQSW